MTGNPSTEVAAPPVAAPNRGVPGERLARLAQRRRLLREEMAVLAVLAVLLAVTIAILAAQWLASGPSASAAIHLYLHLEPGGTT